jgi:hypothetical protein
MTNPFDIQSHSSYVEERLLSRLDAIEEKISRGEISSESERYMAMVGSVREFVESIHAPRMKVRRADKLPLSSDYNEMLEEYAEDIKALLTEADILLRKIEASFTEDEINRLQLEDRLKRVEEIAKDAEELLTSHTEVVYHENFSHQEHEDQSMVRDHAARIWTMEGVLTLQPRFTESFTGGGTVRIRRGNGLPGNTKQIKTSDGNIKFVGEESLHINLGETLDSNADTWFEYEAFWINEETLKDTANLGYEYEEGVSWRFSDPTPLELEVEFELPEAKSVNWISLTPFIPSDKGAVGCRITSIQVEDGKGSVFTPLYQQDSFQSEKVYIFGRKECKKVRIAFVQETSYTTEIGHLYYKEIEKQQMSYLNKVRYETGKRIKGMMPSVENLNVLFDHEKGIIHYHDFKSGTIIEKPEVLKQNLFQAPELPKEETSIQVAYESIPARRYMIGIRDIELAHYQFETTSEYVSKQWSAGGEISAVSLTTEEMIPQEFPEGDWIRYYISPDNGQSWHRIHRRGVSAKGAKILYLFNTNTPSEGRVDAFGYVETKEPVMDIRVKVEIERPSSIINSTYYTPVIYGYGLEIIRKGEEEDVD